MLRSSWVIMGARSLKLFAVVGMSRKEGRSAVNLLAQHHLRERVRQRERREAQQQRGAFFYRRIQAIGAADDEGRGFAEQRRELPGGEVLAAFVQGDHAHAGGNFSAEL